MGNVNRSLNHVIIMGTVGKNPEIKVMASGNKVGNISLASDEGYFDKNNQWIDATEWHRVTVWGVMCDKLSKVQKGDTVLVEGKLHTDSWDGPDGSKRYSTCVIAKRLKHVWDKGRSEAERNGGGYSQQQAYQQHPQQQSQQQPQQQYSSSGMPFAPEDDLPF